METKEISFVDKRFAEAASRVKSLTQNQALLFAHLMASAREGHLCIEYQELGYEPFEHPWVRFEEKRAYLLRHYNLEKSILSDIERLKAFVLFKTEIPDFHWLTDEQKRAATKALREPLTFVCGGPGTGKTTVAATIVKHCVSEKIVVAAPTGKAVANLKAKLGDECEIKTVHSLLGVGKSNALLSLEANLVVVDECSMIDVALFAKLLRAIQMGTRLVLVGDPYQLPPVEPGSIFADLVRKEKEQVIELKKVLRTELKELVLFAQKIKEGKIELGGNEAVEIRALPSKKELIERIVASPERRWLTPLRRGPYGVDALNLSAFRVHEQKMGAKRQIPILITANDKRTSLCNGDSGFVEGGVAYINEQEYRIATLPSYEYAYVISVHKSQGSEYGHVSVILPEGAEKFGKEMLYTAITRASKKVSLLTTPDTLQQIVQKESKRLSGIYIVD